MKAGGGLFSNLFLWDRVSQPRAGLGWWLANPNNLPGSASQRWGDRATWNHTWTFLCVPRSELRSSWLRSKCFYQLSHLSNLSHRSLEMKPLLIDLHLFSQLPGEMLLTVQEAPVFYRVLVHILNQHNCPWKWPWQVLSPQLLIQSVTSKSNFYYFLVETWIEGLSWYLKTQNAKQ